MPLKLYERPKGSGNWFIRGTVQGTWIDRSARTRKRAEAEALRAKWEADLFTRAVYGERAVATFAEASTAYMKAGGARDHLAALLGLVGLKKLSEIDQALVDGLAAEREGSAPATLIRQIYTPISAVMNFAAEQKLCDPVRFRKPQVKNGRLDYLTPDEAEKLLGLLPPYMAQLVTFYLATGCRATEALDLEWRDVSPEGKRVVFWETKNGHPRGVDLQKRAQGQFPARTEEAAGPVFLNSRETPWHGYDAINLMMARHLGDRFRHVHCHLFRHTWATWAYACTRDLTFVMQQGGWRSAAMVMRYAHAGSEDLARSVLGRGWEFGGREIFKPPRKSRK